MERFRGSPGPAEKRRRITHAAVELGDFCFYRSLVLA
jgi:hypothetical protein